MVDHLPDFFTDPAAPASAAKAQEQAMQDLYAQIGKLTTQLAWIKKIWPRPGARRTGGRWWTGTTGTFR